VCSSDLRVEERHANHYRDTLAKVKS
jgi:hypothetical protein